jgi:hypothetical protein
MSGLPLSRVVGRVGHLVSTAARFESTAVVGNRVRHMRALVEATIASPMANESNNVLLHGLQRTLEQLGTDLDREELDSMDSNFKASASLQAGTLWAQAGHPWHRFAPRLLSAKLPSDLIRNNIPRPLNLTLPKEPVVIPQRWASFVVQGYDRLLEREANLPALLALISSGMSLLPEAVCFLADNASTLHVFTPSDHTIHARAGDNPDDYALLDSLSVRPQDLAALHIGSALRGQGQSGAVQASIAHVLDALLASSYWMAAMKDPGTFPISRLIVDINAATASDRQLKAPEAHETSFVLQAVAAPEYEDRLPGMIFVRAEAAGLRNQWGILAPDIGIVEPATKAALFRNPQWVRDQVAHALRVFVPVGLQDTRAEIVETLIPGAHWAIAYARELVVDHLDPFVFEARCLS